MTQLSVLRLVLCVSVAASLLAQQRPERYALFFGDAPLRELSRKRSVRAAAYPNRAQQIRAAQAQVRTLVEAQGMAVTGTADTLLNAIFVQASAEQSALLQQLPGVVRVQRLRTATRHSLSAATVVNATAAWQAVGGEQNAGRGVRIAVIDTGIDNTHPAFDPAGFTAPSGFPACNGDDCRYTSGKIIVARSYVNRLVGTNPTLTRPDDLTPRDRVGHGTLIAALAAGRRQDGPQGTAVGIAPGAYLGNYKVYGSPGVNDVTFEDVVILALEDAFRDGMDIAVLALGFPAVFGYDDPCPNSINGNCDPIAAAVQEAVEDGMLVVTSAGNSGATGQRVPTLGAVDSPGTAPDALTVGASTNTEVYYQTLRVENADAPEALRNARALFGNGPLPASPLQAPLRDAARSSGNARACSPLPAGSLQGAVALIELGDCSPADKVINAQAAGAVAVILYQSGGGDTLYSNANLQGTGIPTVDVGASTGSALQAIASSRDDLRVTLDPAFQRTSSTVDQVALFSSRGPATGFSDIKPEVIAPGTGIYGAVQRLDPNGELYSATGYRAAQGSSLSAALAAGAAAVVMQRTNNFDPFVAKSAVVNTARSGVLEALPNGQTSAARVVAAGAGRLDVEAAIRTNVVANLAALSFGALSRNAAFPNLSLRLSNIGTQSVSLQLQVQPQGSTGSARVSLSTGNVTIAAGQSTTVTARVEGSLPSPGSYEGVVTIIGGAVPLRVPYLFLVGDGNVADIYPLSNGDFVGIPAVDNFDRYITFKAVDQYGVPVTGAPVRFSVVTGGGRIEQPDPQTDTIGIAASRVTLGSAVGRQQFSATVGSRTVNFIGRTRPELILTSEGVVNAASQRAEQGYAPGSFITLYGQNLSEATQGVSFVPFPLSLANVSVSFDAPDGSRSVPARLAFVSPTQVNLVIPYELQGLSSVRMKVSLDRYSTRVIDLPLSAASPAAFEYSEGGTLFAAALDTQFRLIGPANAARRGQVVQIYANGLGAVNQTVGSGEVAPANPPAVVTDTPTVTIAGRTAAVQFAGLSPGSVALYQINVLVPEDTPTGVQPVVITVGGRQAKTVSLPIQ